MKVIIGAGEQRWDGWIATQKDEIDLLDEGSWVRYFGETKANAFLCEHVFEHLTFNEAIEAARIIKNYLHTDGYIRLAVPDGNFQDEEYQNIIKVGGPGPPDHPAADHKFVYNHRSLTEVFKRAGFRTSLLEYHDENGDFVSNEWNIKDGPVYRSSKMDPRNRGRKIQFPSLIMDAFPNE